MLYFNFLLIYLLITLVYIIYCIIIYFSSVDINNLNILLKTPHLCVADIILRDVPVDIYGGGYGFSLRGENFFSHQTGGEIFFFHQAGGEIFFFTTQGEGIYFFHQTGRDFFQESRTRRFFQQSNKS